MAHYLCIQEFGTRGDVDATRANFQATLDYFVKWTPPEGVELLQIWVALDLGRSFSLWEADDPLHLTTMVANFLPFGNIEAIPVGEVQAMIGAMIAGGLMESPNPA